MFHSTTGTPGDTGLAPERIRRQLESSLERLGVDRVDFYLAHEPDEAMPLADTIAAFEAAREEGLIGAWGLSNFDADGLGEALRHGTPALLQTRTPCSSAATRGGCSRSASSTTSRTCRSGRFRRVADRQVPPR